MGEKAYKDILKAFGVKACQRECAYLSASSKWSILSMRLYSLDDASCMKDSLRRISFCLAFYLLAAPICGCAYSRQIYVHHSFQLEVDKSVELLNYQYGGTKATGTHADEGYLATGHIPQSERTAGMLPVGDFLFVKWKVVFTGRIYEDTVGLKRLLPTNMNDKVLYVYVKGTQLYVHIIEGKDESAEHSNAAPDCPVEQFKMQKCALIYPTRWSNF